MNTNRRFRIYFSSTIIIVFAFALSSWKEASPAHRWEYLKDLAAPQTVIGSHVNWYHIFPDNEETRVIKPFFQQELELASLPGYWKTAWKGPGSFDMEKTNQLVNYFTGQNIRIHGWLPFGPQHYLPEWFVGSHEDKWSNASKWTVQNLEDFMESIIREALIPNDNSSKVEIWTCVNECFWLPGGSYYAGTIWNSLGYEPDQSGLKGAEKVLENHPVYIRKAFEIARKYTKSRLALRERRCEFPTAPQNAPGVNDHYHAFYQLALHLVNSGVPIDAVEFQTHLSAGVDYDWKGFKENIRRYRELGLDVHIGELDVGHDGTSRGLQAQRETYYHAVKAAREAGAQMICFWGIRQGSMGDYRREEDALILDLKGNPKPAYYGVVQALLDTRR